MSLLPIVFLVTRYLHIVCATLLVGGTLFYEMVVPVAIGDLKQEQQLLIFARARWVFKWIVWLSAAILVLSGVSETFLHWHIYTTVTFATYGNSLPGTTQPFVMPLPTPSWSIIWWAAHSAAGVISLIIAVSLTIGNTPPMQPIRWMRLNLMILLLVIFLGTATQRARLAFEEQVVDQRLVTGVPQP